MILAASKGMLKVADTTEQNQSMGPMDHKSSPEWAQLERFLKRVGFGEVFDVPIVRGKPRLDRPLRYRSSVLLGPSDRVRSCSKKGDGLRDERFQRLILECEQRGDVLITALHVLDGLPHRFDIEGELVPQ